MYLTVEENPNCEALEGRVFQVRSDPKPITQVQRRVMGQESWWDVTGVNENFEWVPAVARKVEDSGDGICYLVSGGSWGLRYKAPGQSSWNAADPTQTGESFLLLPSDGADLKFAEHV